MESGVNCLPYTSYLEMMATKRNSRKPAMFAFIISSSPFPTKKKSLLGRPMKQHGNWPKGCSRLRMCGSDSLRYRQSAFHIIVNSVNFRDGKKLHLSPHPFRRCGKSTTRFVWHTDFPCWNLMMAERKSTGLPPRIRAAERARAGNFNLSKP